MAKSEIKKLKFPKVKNYEIQITEQIGREILTNRYWKHMDIVQLNQCPACKNTNINMDPWILACVGNGGYVYARPNKRAKDVYRDNWPTHSESTEERIEYTLGRGIRSVENHAPMEMAQEIITHKEAKKRFKQ